MKNENKFFKQKAFRKLFDKLAKSGSVPTGCHANILLIFQSDPALNTLISFDEFTLDYQINNAVPVFDNDFTIVPGPYPRTLVQADIIRILAYIQKYYAPKCFITALQECLIVIAQNNSFHPVTSWLNNLVWDKESRLDQWLSAVYGTEATTYYKAIGSKFLIAAVRRVRNPGCKFDQMMILEGPQGIGKSTSLALLFGKVWFTDQIDKLNKKESAMDLRGKWCAEFSEIEQLIRSDVETVKAFLSRSVDHFRAPWAKASADFPRQCVLIGTTNAAEYLKDSTGNRRIWPVKCQAFKAIDLKWLCKNRDQLWAEAAYREALCEDIWLSESPTCAEAERIQESRLQEDPWAAKIAVYLADKKTATSNELLTNALSIRSDLQTREATSRVASIIRGLGWESVSKWNATLKKSVRQWHISLDVSCEDNN